MPMNVGPANPQALIQQMLMRRQMQQGDGQSPMMQPPANGMMQPGGMMPQGGMPPGVQMPQPSTMPGMNVGPSNPAMLQEMLRRRQMMMGNNGGPPPMMGNPQGMMGQQ